VTDDGEFRFPPSLEPRSYGELKYLTMWELYMEPPVYEPYAGAEHVPSGNREALAEHVLVELYEEGYVAVVRRRWDDDGSAGELLTESEARKAFSELRTHDAWRSRDAAIFLVPTEKWWAWARIEKGLR
jgi:hypothetical protein